MEEKEGLTKKEALDRLLMNHFVVSKKINELMALLETLKKKNNRTLDDYAQMERTFVSKDWRLNIRQESNLKDNYWVCKSCGNMLVNICPIPDDGSGTKGGFSIRCYNCGARENI